MGLVIHKLFRDWLSEHFVGNLKEAVLGGTYEGSQ